MNDDVDTVESRSGLVPTTVDVRSSLVRRLEEALEEEGYVEIEFKRPDGTVIDESDPYGADEITIHDNSYMSNPWGMHGWSDEISDSERDRSYYFLSCVEPECDLHQAYYTKREALVVWIKHLVSNPTHIGARHSGWTPGKALHPSMFPEDGDGDS